MSHADFDPTFDLVLERIVDLTPEQLWDGWTKPEHLVHWFTPAPWTTVEAVTDVRPGGLFRTVMASPEGHRNEGNGCYLETVYPNRLVWTAALGPGFRPNDFSQGGFPFTAMLTFEPVEGGTKYTARAMHATAEANTTHAEMGFVAGWGAALDQLLAYMKKR